jgi:Porphyromonas-type peptidyl-arginine deiminase
MFAKLLNDNTVLISTCQQEPFKSNGQKAFDYFSKKNAPNGKPYKVFTVDGWTKQGVWYTYTNSLIVNGIVIIPSYTGYASQVNLILNGRRLLSGEFTKRQCRESELYQYRAMIVFDWVDLFTVSLNKFLLYKCTFLIVY